jgi:L-threonylcarbamoyladenylate synthase
MTKPEEIEKAAEIIRGGGLAVFPTETVYGLGANALDASAVRKIYELKGRPAKSPLIVHVADLEQARTLAADWPAAADRLASEFWPGPLTLVVPKKAIIPNEVTAGLSSVGLRVPRHPVALALLRVAGVPIAAPSANRFTQLSPTTAQHVRDAFGTETPYLLDGGPCEVGIESTVIAVTKDGLEVLRPGMAMVGNSFATQASPAGSHRAPGQHQKHYSPRTRVLLVVDGRVPVEGRGAYLFVEREAWAVSVHRMPDRADEYAAKIYGMLHALDAQGYDWIAVELPPPTPEWAAVRDRLTRAAY